MECRLQYGEVWSCKISLRFNFDRTGHPLSVVRDIPFGATLHNADDVEKMLRRAQRAILRPDLDPTLFLDDSDLHVFGVPMTFSRNCVCIQVSGPNVSDLYFYDLPGEYGDPWVSESLSDPSYDLRNYCQRWRRRQRS